MFSWFRKLHSGAAPHPGERWALPERNDPWGGSRYPPSIILDVKDGWVRYCVGGFKDGPFRDERMEQSKFMSIYHRVES